MQSPFNPNFGKVPQLFLDRQQIIKNVTYGYVSFNLPLFKEFIQEQIELEKFNF